MKRLFIAFLALIPVTSLLAQKKIADVAKFSTDTYDFGKVKQNAPPTATFVVTNIGDEPLIIEEARPTCGCTISDYTKSPIAPGKTGTIKATYNAANLGAIHKTLTVKFSGITEMKPINLAGEVLEPAAYDKWLAGNKASGDSSAKAKSETGSVKDVKKSVKKSTVKS